jgi:hypothetical protein
MKERAGVYADSPQAIVNNHFSDIVIREDCWTVKVGAGLTWADVYKYLVPKGLNVVGGRLDGVAATLSLALLSLEASAIPLPAQLIHRRN